MGVPQEYRRCWGDEFTRRKDAARRVNMSAIALDCDSYRLRWIVLLDQDVRTSQRPIRNVQERRVHVSRFSTATVSCQVESVVHAKLFNNILLLCKRHERRRKCRNTDDGSGICTRRIFARVEIVRGN